MTHLELGRLSNRHRNDVFRDDFDGEKSIRFGKIWKNNDATMTTKRSLLLHCMRFVVYYYHTNQLLKKKEKKTHVLNN
jgi:hypothetical protein